MATSKVRNDWIPMKAGIARITQLDENFNPMWGHSITTKRDFVQSITKTTSSTSETLPNGNGQDKEFPTDETRNLAVATDTYDQRWHAVVSGFKKVDTPRPIMYDTTIKPVKGTGNAEYTFADQMPVAGEDGKEHFEIRDSYGNLLTQSESDTTGQNYTYTSGEHKLKFAEEYAGKELSCVYYIAGTGGEAYESPTTIRSRVFQIEVMGEIMSASTGEPARYYCCLKRANVSGDIPDVTTQKSRVNTLTYNFKSAPVPVGVSPFYESITPIVETAQAVQPLSIEGGGSGSKK